MSIRPEIILLILGCMGVTVLPRILPMAFANRLHLPAWFLAWLRYIPVSVIAALFFREVLLTAGAFRQWDDPYLIAGLLTLVAAFVFRNILLTVVVGAVVFTALRFILGG